MQAWDYFFPMIKGKFIFLSFPVFNISVSTSKQLQTPLTMEMTS